MLHAIGVLDPADPRTRGNVAAIRGLLDGIPSHRLFAPTRDVMCDAAVYAGVLCRLQAYAKDRRMRALHDCTLFFQARKLGLTLVSANVIDFRPAAANAARGACAVLRNRLVRPRRALAPARRFRAMTSACGAPTSSLSSRRCFRVPLGLSLAGDGLARGLWRLDAHDIRAHGIGPPSHGRRHAGRWRRRHGDAGRRARREPRRACPRRRSAPAPADDAARRAVDASARPRARRRGRRGARLRALRGRRRAPGRRPRARGGVDRRLRALRRRDRRARAARRLRTPAARHHGPRRLGRRRELRGGLARIPALHAARATSRAARSPMSCSPATMRGLPAGAPTMALRLTRERRPDLLRREPY